MDGEAAAAFDRVIRFHEAEISRLSPHGENPKVRSKIRWHAEAVRVVTAMKEGTWSD